MCVYRLFHLSDFNPLTPCGVRLVLICSDSLNNNFNPLTPCGVRLNDNEALTVINRFQSTHPVWGETKLHVIEKGERLISIHSPRVG